MRKYFKGVCLLCCVCFISLSSCTKTPLPPPEFSYEKNAIRIRAKADPQLNLYEGRPHTLLICVYQLSDPNTFNQLTGHSDGLGKLLECGRLDPSVIYSERLIIHPGEFRTFQLDRAEGTKYVGLIAGYAFMHKDGMTSLFEVPVTVEIEGFISRTKISKCAELNIDLFLGPQQISETKTFGTGSKE